MLRGRWRCKWFEAVLDDVVDGNKALEGDGKVIDGLKAVHEGFDNGRGNGA